MSEGRSPPCAADPLALHQASNIGQQVVLAEPTCKSAALSQRAHYASRLEGVSTICVYPNATPSPDHVQGLGCEGIGSGVSGVHFLRRKHGTKITSGIPDMEL